MEIVKNAKYIKPSAHQIGNIPQSSICHQFWKNSLFWLNYRRAGNIAFYFQSYIAWDYVFNLDSHLYFIVPKSLDFDGTTGKLYYGCILRLYYRTDTSEVKIYIDGTLEKTLSMPNGNNVGHGEVIDVTRVDLVFDRSLGADDDLYRTIDIRVDGAVVHSASFFDVPPNKNQLENLSDRDLGIDQSMFSSQCLIHGSDDYTSTPYSIGSLIGRQSSHPEPDVSKNKKRDSVVGASRKCLYHWMHCEGFYYDGPGSIAYQELFRNENGDAYEISVSPSNLRGKAAGEITCDVVVFAMSDDDTKIKFESQTAGDSCEIDLGDHTSEGCLHCSSPLNSGGGLALDVGGDRIKISGYVSSSKALVLLSFAFYEPATGINL